MPNSLELIICVKEETHSKLTIYSPFIMCSEHDQTESCLHSSHLHLPGAHAKSPTCPRYIRCSLTLCNQGAARHASSIGCTRGSAGTTQRTQLTSSCAKYSCGRPTRSRYVSCSAFTRGTSRCSAGSWNGEMLVRRRSSVQMFGKASSCAGPLPTAADRAPVCARVIGCRMLQVCNVRCSIQYVDWSARRVILDAALSCPELRNFARLNARQDGHLRWGQCEAAGASRQRRCRCATQRRSSARQPGRSATATSLHACMTENSCSSTVTQWRSLLE